MATDHSHDVVGVVPITSTREWLERVPLECDVVDGKPTLDVVAGTLAGDKIRCRFAISRSVLPDDKAMAVRYLAASVNNLAMTRGVLSYRLEGDRSLVADTRRELQLRFSQIDQLATVFGELVKRQSISAITPPTFTCGSWHMAKPGRPTRSAVGVNVGQSFIKAVWCGRSGEHQARAVVPTFSGAGSRGDRLRVNTITVIKDLLRTSTEDIAAIGLSLGGMVYDGYILPGSGVTVGLAEVDCQRVQSLPKQLEELFELPVLVAQDVKCKAYFHAARTGWGNCLIVDLGTSLGGSYIDADGRIPRHLNQIGRVVYDLSPHAKPRSDGTGAGLLSQYLSASGIIELARECGVAAMDSSDLERMITEPENAVIHRIIGTFGRRLRASLMILDDHYELESVILTGGLLAGRLAPLLGESHAVVDGLPMRLARSPEPIFDSSMGAAWAAANQCAL